MYLCSYNLNESTVFSIIFCFPATGSFIEITTNIIKNKKRLKDKIPDKTN